MKEKKVIILYSGGADSLYLIILAQKMGYQVDLLMYRYGQIHGKEIDSGLTLLEQKRFVNLPEPTIIDLESCFEGIDSKLLGVAPEKPYPDVHEMHVPGRNGIFISVALGLAESLGYDEVWIGSDYSDRINLFPDCYQEWIVKQDGIAKTNGSRPLRVKAPLLGLEKEDVLALLKNEGVDIAGVFSGYTSPSQKPKKAPEIHV